MKHIITLILITFTLAGLVTNVSAKTKKKTTAINHNAPIDLSELIQLYNTNKHLDNSGLDGILYDKFIVLLKPEDKYYMGLQKCDSAPISLPMYANSKNPYLAHAQEIYNSCITSYSISSNLQTWLRLDQNDTLQEITKFLQAYNIDYIQNKEVRETTTALLNEAIALTSGKKDDDSLFYDIDNKLDEQISSLFPKYDDSDKIVKNTIQTGIEKFKRLADKRFHRYENSEDSVQTEVILNELNNCKTFDEQCSLWMRWANHNYPGDEVFLVFAVAQILVTSDKYAPNLNMIWETWRSMMQFYGYGPSSYTFMPNDYFNSVRARCYIAVLKHIESAPKDYLAMACASALACTPNLCRFGSLYGNESPKELRRLLPESFSN